MNKTSRLGGKSFILVELLVVIFILGMLASILLLAIQSARESARRLSCTNNMTQLILAVHHYEMAHTKFPIGSVGTGPIVHTAQGYHHNWVSATLAFWGQPNAAAAIDYSVGVYDPANAPSESCTFNLRQRRIVNAIAFQLRRLASSRRRTD